MEWPIILLLLLGCMLGLMALGVPVAFAFFAANMLGAFMFQGGDAGLIVMSRSMMDTLASFILMPIPLFILMGEVLFHTGVAFRAIDAIERLINRMPGRLSVVTVLGGTVFSSLSGSTIANTALLGSTLLPEMLKRGYKPSIAVGPIMATGSIAMLIPPSALAVLLGSLATSMGGPLAATQMSVGKILLAGIIPGLLMSAFFLGYVILRCRMNPDLAPAYDTGAETMTAKERWMPFFIYVVPLMSLFGLVVGSIIAGWASPSESAALGATGAIIISALYRSLTWPGLRKALLETAKISCMILFIIAASVTFSRILNFSGATFGLLSAVQALDTVPWQLLILMMLLLLFLGAFMDQVSMLLITLPFFVPLALAAEIDLLMLGVMTLIAMEISFMTPPFGLLIFVMRGVAPPGITLNMIYKSALPFIGLALLVMALVAFIPIIATWPG